MLIPSGTFHFTSRWNWSGRAGLKPGGLLRHVFHGESHLTDEAGFRTPPWAIA